MALPFRTFGVLLLTVFLDLLAFGMIIPILPLYALELHATPRQIGLLVAVYSAMQLLFSPILGRLSDRFGRRPVLLISICGSLLSQIGYSFAHTVEALLLARAVAGACGANISAAQAYIADVTDDSNRTSAMGLLGAALGLGFVFGPTLGGILGGHNPALPFLVAAALSGVNLVWAFFALQEPRPVGERRAANRMRWDVLVRTLGQPELRLLIGLFFLITLGFSAFEVTFAIFLKDRFGYGQREASYAFAFIGVWMVIAQGVLVRRLVPRLGEPRLMMIGTGLMAFGLAVLSWAHTSVELFGANAMVAIGMGLQSPSMSSLISKRAGELQGSVLGVSQSFGSLGRILGPIAGGFLLAESENAPLYAGAMLIGLASVIIGLAVERPAPAT